MARLCNSVLRWVVVDRQQEAPGEGDQEEAMDPWMLTRDKLRYADALEDTLEFNTDFM